MSVAFGSIYHNDKQLAQFVHCIAEAYKANLSRLIKSSDLFSLLIHSSTVVDFYCLATRFLDLKRLLSNAWATYFKS